MNVDEAIEALKAQDPRLLVMLAELCAAVKAARTANDQESAWRRMEGAIVQLVKASGADDELLKSQIKEASDATKSTGKPVTRADLDNADLGFADGGTRLHSGGVFTPPGVSPDRNCRNGGRLGDRRLPGSGQGRPRALAPLWTRQEPWRRHFGRGRH